MIVTVITAIFFWEGHKGFSMSDEGFLWYGAQRVLLGEIPFRDFDSYDIGRYYWSAAFMSLAGDNGVVILRMAAMLFQTIALCIGLSMLIRNSKRQSNIFWLLAVISLMVWMVHPHKLFDISLPVILIGSLAYLIEQPSHCRYFLIGLIVGLVAVFGRNHGLYGVVGSISVMFYLIIKRENAPSLITAFTYWSLGVIVGYLPVLIFLAVVPGFALAFWGYIRQVFEIKATNILLSVPWPWLLPFGKLSTVEIMRGMIIGTFFIALVVFGVLGIAWVIRQRLQNKPVSPVLVASFFLALPYAHYAFSRADLFHLARSTPPFIIGIFALLASQPAKTKWPFAALLCGVSLFIMLPIHPGWYCQSNHQCVNIKVAKDNLKVHFRTAQNLTMLNNIATQFIPHDRTFICAPFCPGAYAILGRKSPIWNIYATGTSGATFQQAEIERIKASNPCLAIIDNSSIDGREDLRFCNTNSIVYQYIIENFERVNDATNNPAIYRSKQSKK